MRFLALAVVLLTSLSPQAFADYEEGVAAQQRGDYAAALREFLPLAERGDFEDQFAIGWLNEMGRGVPRADRAEALRWYRRSAEGGYPEAQYRLYQLSQFGMDKQEQLRLLKSAAEQGHLRAQADLGQKYLWGDDLPIDIAEGLKWYHRAAEGGEKYAQYWLGEYYEEGQYVWRDHREALKWYRRSAEGGLPLAQYRIGLAYYRGELGLQQDSAEAIRWLLSAGGGSSEIQDSRAQALLGVIYYEGRYVLQDYREALRWLGPAVRTGQGLAFHYLGLMHANGYGVPTDLVWAYAFFNLATIVSDDALAESSSKYRDQIRTKLTHPQITRAQELSRGLQECLSDHIRRKTSPERHTAPGLTVVEEFDKWMHEGLRAKIEREQVCNKFFDSFVASLGRSSSGTGLPSPPGEVGRSPASPDRLSAASVIHTQEVLAALGYDPGPADGQPGSKTRAAIRAFQSDHGLPATGELSEGVTTALDNARRAKVKVATRGKIAKYAIASGFVVSSEGHLLTNAHVVEGCREVRTPPDGIAERVATDTQTDLALLKARKKSGKPATFREGTGIRPGDTIVVAGFPLQGLLASDLNVTTGTVSALAGPGDDRRLLQITAPVQPGNSGGPLLDLSGNIVGVVVGKLDALKVARRIGDIPQNVNFAISSGIVRAFLDAQGVPYKTGPSDATLTPADVAGRARDFTLLVECWK